MKLILSLAVSLGFVSLVEAAEIKTEFVEAQEWLDHVEWVRQRASHDGGTLIAALQELDPALLREYFRQFTPLEVPRDIEWKTRGLAIYGSSDDLPQLDGLISGLPSFLETPDKAVFVRSWRDALIMREGDATAAGRAADRIAKSSADKHQTIELFEMSRSGEGVNRLVEIGTDDTLPLLVRGHAISSLERLGDHRYLDMTLSPSFVACVTKHYENASADFVLGIVLKDTSRPELVDARSIEEARALVKKLRLNEKPSPEFAQVRKTVRGGIDWSEFVKQTSRALSKAGPASVPKRTEQPKPEKPTAAVPPQKPPANNAGTLIAAGAAIVGLLAVLLWFWRRK